MVRRFVLWVLAWYRQYRGLRPDACRFDPTCSAYANEAVEIHGPVKGLFLAGRRVLRCHPLGKQGYDPVPSAPAQSQGSPRQQMPVIDDANGARRGASTLLRPEHRHA